MRAHPLSLLLPLSLALSSTAGAAETKQLGKGTDPQFTGPVLRTTTAAYNHTLYQMLLSGGALDRLGISPGTTIDAIELEKASAGATMSPGKLEVWVKQTTDTSYPSDSKSTWAAVKAGATNVFSSTAFSIPAGNGFVPLGPFTTPFTTDGTSIALGIWADLSGVTTTSTIDWVTYPATLKARLLGSTSAIDDSRELTANSQSFNKLPNARITFTRPSGGHLQLLSGLQALERDAFYDSSPSMAAATQVPLTFTVRNLGDQAATISAIDVGGSPTNVVLAVQTTVPFDVPAGSSVPFVINQTPIASGPVAFSFSFESSNALNVTPTRPFVVNVTGTAAATPKEETDINFVFPNGDIVPLNYNPATTIQLGTLPLDQPVSYIVNVANIGSKDLKLYGETDPTVNAYNLVGLEAVRTNVPAHDALIPPQTDVKVGLTITGRTLGPATATISVYTYETGESLTFAFLQGTVAAVAPNLNIQMPSGLFVANNGEGTLTGGTKFPAGVATPSFTYLSNGGTDVLTISQLAAEDFVNCSVSTTTPPPTIGVAEIHQHDVTITPTAVGDFSYKLKITSDDPVDFFYTITVKGTAVSGEPDIEIIDVSPLAEGAAITTLNGGDHHQVFIKNVGLDQALIGSVGVTPTNCTATASIASFNLAKDEDIPLVVTVADRTGTWEVLVDVTSNDPDESKRSFFLRGTVPPPDIAVTGFAEIVNGSTEIAAVDVAALGYTVRNDGQAPLTITGNPVILDAQNITVTPSGGFVGVLEPGDSYSFSLTLTATSADWSFRVSIPSDDPNENPFAWTVKPMTVIAGDPDVKVACQPLHLLPGNYTVGTATAQPLLTIDEAPLVPLDIDCLITNEGAAPLAVGSMVMTATGCTAEVTSMPSADVAPGATATVGLTLTPPAGLKSKQPFSTSLTFTSKVSGLIDGSWKPQGKGCAVGGDGPVGALGGWLVLLALGAFSRAGSRRTARSNG